MGLTSNHAMVFAQIHIPEEDDKLDINKYGIGAFIVQIRDRDTHKHMPGVKTGDMGPKHGYNSKENGWMILD